MLTVPILTLLAGVKSGEINETLEAKRRDFAIEEKQVDALTWTPEGTVRSTQERPFVRGKTQVSNIFQAHYVISAGYFLYLKIKKSLKCCAKLCFKNSYCLSNRSFWDS